MLLGVNLTCDAQNVHIYLLFLIMYLCYCDVDDIPVTALPELCTKSTLSVFLVRLMCLSPSRTLTGGPAIYIPMLTSWAGNKVSVSQSEGQTQIYSKETNKRPVGAGAGILTSERQRARTREN